ncbi:MAG: OmpA family protein, partial [Cytophagales bacterium]|nr:OmpA family protein [Cytophaga sp.]
YFRVEEYDDAIPYYEQLVTDYPENENYKYYLGVCYYKIGKPEKALELFKAASNNSDLTTKNIEFDYYIARSLHLAQQYQEAIPYYKAYMDKITASTDKDAFKHTAPKIQIEIERCQHALELQKTPAAVQIVNIGNVINSTYPDYMPVISLDEKEMMFTSRRNTTTGGQKDPNDLMFYEDVYVSVRNDSGVWQNPKNMGTVVNTPTHDATVCLSADGKQLYIYRSEINRLGETFRGNIYKTQKMDSSWTLAQKLPAPINSDFWEPSTSISAQEKTFFFTSDRPKGTATQPKDRDIYMVKLNKDGSWSTPINLPFNTPYEEDGPFFHPDGKTLYFASNGPKSIGGFDLFKTTYTDSKNAWSEPENIGFPYNTPNDDIYIVWSADGRRVYFSSARDDSYGGKDIYIATSNTTTSMAVMIGNVYDIATNKPIEAEIIVTDVVTGEVAGIYLSDKTTGKFSLAIPSGKNYSVVIDEDGYLFHSENIKIPRLADFQEYRKDVFLTPFKAGSREILKNVFFDTDKAILKPESKVELDRLFALIKTKKNVHIMVAGHTDDRAPHDYNYVLSQARACAIVNYLIDKGIDSSIFFAKRYDETEPIESNATTEGRLLNRRVEYTILDMEDDAHNTYAHSTDISLLLPGDLRYNDLLKDFKEVFARDMDLKAPELNKMLYYKANFISGVTKELTEYSSTRLNALVDYMNQYKGMKLKLIPHGDLNIPADKNLLIANERAKTVYAFLIKNGIKSTRLIMPTSLEVKAILGDDTATDFTKSKSVEFLVTDL